MSYQNGGTQKLAAKQDVVAIAIIFFSALAMRLPASWDFRVSGDAANYVKLAWSMRFAHLLDRPAGIMYSFGYSIFIYLASYLIPNLDQAALAVSVFFGVFSTILLFLIGRRLLGYKTGLAAGLGLAFFGPHIAISTSPLGESTYVFWALLSILVFLEGIFKPRHLFYYAASGALFGFTFIIRPEIQITFFFMAILGLYLLYKKSGVQPKRLIVIAALLGMSFLAVNVPKIIWLHNVTGNWMLDVRKNGTIGVLDKLQDQIANNAPYWEMKSGVEESSYGLSSQGEMNFATQRSFGRWLMANPKERLSYYWNNVIVSFKNLNIQVIFLIILAGIFLFLGKGGAANKMLLGSFFTPMLFIPFFYAFGGGSWYARPETVIVFSPILVLMAVAGLVECFDRLNKLELKNKRLATYIILLAITLLWVKPVAAIPVNLVKNWGTPGPQNVTVLMDQRLGEWIDKNLPPDARIMTRSWEISRYSNREREILPFAPFPDEIAYARKKNVNYIIVGGAREWYRPQLDFLIPPDNEGSRDLYENSLVLVAEFQTINLDGYVLPYQAAIYRVK